MRFMLLQDYKVEGAEPMTTWPPEDVKAHIEFQHRLNDELTERGELVDAQGLAPPEAAKIVVHDGESAPAVTDGPFPESKEFLAGYRIVDVESPARAIEIAALSSASPGPGGIPESPVGWLVHVASAADDRPDAKRGGPAPPREPRCGAGRGEPRPRRGRRPRRQPRRHPGADVHVLPPGAQPRLRDRPLAAGRGGPDHGGDRRRVPGPRADDGAADQPRQAERQGVRRSIPDALGGRLGPPAALSAARALPDLQRGLRDQRRRRAGAGGSRGRRSGWPGSSTQRFPTTPRSRACSP